MQFWMNQQHSKLFADIKLLLRDMMNDFLYEKKINPPWHDDKRKPDEVELQVSD